jgi:hypothetical protein
MKYPCSGCGLHSCDGRCFTECAADYAAEPEHCRCGEILKDGECSVCDAKLTECRGDPMQRKDEAA